MTQKKDIVRKPTYTLPGGTRITTYSLGPGFTLKETAFVIWYTYPGSEAFLNAGRAAARAGYKGAVWQGYQLKQKPRIAKKIEELLIPVEMELHDLAWRIAFLCADRMFFKVTDFYRPCKRTVKIRGVEQETDSFEAIPLNEISERNRMCIDGIDIKTICGKDEFWYKLPDRHEAFGLFMECYKILMPEKNVKGEMDLEATAEIIRGGVAKPVIARTRQSPEKRGKSPIRRIAGQISGAARSKHSNPNSRPCCTC
jgi:hypothetical protein